MKKTILILILLAFALLSFSQGKETAKHIRTQKQAHPYLDSLNKLDSLGKVLDKKHEVKNDTAKADQVLHIDLQNKEQGEAVLKALQAGYTAMQLSENISAAQLTTSNHAYEYLMNLIFKKWPALLPKQPKQ